MGKPKFDDIEMLVAYGVCNNCSEIRQEVVVPERDLNRFGYSCRCGGGFDFVGVSPVALVKERD